MMECDLIASMPEQLLQAEWARDQLAVLPIRERLPGVSVQVITRRDSPLTPAAAMLLDCLRDSARRRVALSRCPRSAIFNASSS